MNIIISNSSDSPIYEQIVNQIRNQIIDDSLKFGDLLPSIRSLAKDLKISVITTKRAYDDLEKEGFIEVVPGKGCYVANKNKDFIREEQLKLSESYLQKAVDVAKISNISYKELEKILLLLYEDTENL